MTLLIPLSHFLVARLSPGGASREEHADRNFTRHVINELAIHKSHPKIQIFENMERAILGETAPNKSHFWNYLAFFNFLQEPMSNLKARPTAKQFKKGWSPFFNLIEALKPKVCIFSGVSCASTFSSALNSSLQFKSARSLEKHNQISKTAPRTATIQDSAGTETKLIFIRHASQQFPHKKWHEFIKNEMPKEAIPILKTFLAK